nr:N-formylglutamate amidohydrolase [Lactobacillus helveticus]
MNRSPVVFDLPHSGTTIIAEMADALLPTAVLANTDWFLRELYDFFARAWVYSFRK